MKQITLTKCIVPIMRIDADGNATELLGTGFFVKSKRMLMVTAKHVLDGVKNEAGESIGIVPLNKAGKVDVWQLRRNWVSRTYDVAIFDVSPLKEQGVEIEPLALSEVEVPGNVDVLTWEFSGTTNELMDDGRLNMQLIPFARKGNIMRYYNSTFPERHPTRSFDVSFPALQGASGAPVIDNRNLTVAGMLVANRERHLLPAQIVRADLGGKDYEEIKYFLPTGKAIASSVLISKLAELDATDDADMEVMPWTISPYTLAQIAKSGPGKEIQSEP
jgi:hypothetical protein